MKSIVWLLCWLSVALAAPAEPEPVIILKYDNTNDGLGSYKYEFETSDGTSKREEGTLRNADDPENSFLAVRGSYSYIGPDGVTYTVMYVADENGFQPQGDHIPGATPGNPDDYIHISSFASGGPPPPLPPEVITSLLG